jgi:predicted HicB family RNase H-like nuclease
MTSWMHCQTALFERNTNMLEGETSMAFDKYQVEIVPDNDEFVAYLLEIPTLSAYGDTEEEALRSLEGVYARAKKALKARGQDMPLPLATRDYSGRFNVRVPRNLHKKLVISAEREGVSLNAMVASILTERLSRFSNHATASEPKKSDDTNHRLAI